MGACHASPFVSPMLLGQTISLPYQRLNIEEECAILSSEFADEASSAEEIAEMRERALAERTSLYFPAGSWTFQRR